ncbi:hypothetical protein ACFXPI_15570 [Streptomyces sp. NPDC059104]|uniref:hypothetical protein n=1 Tax=Streptomyces sp. NPDC059104 TaxID=3346729 RepID=UPI0036B43E2D
MTTPDGPGAVFRPTHVVPPDGLPAWEAPDATRPTTALDAFLPVRLLSRSGDWGEVLCANGWSAWVDGRLLVAVPRPPPTGGRPTAPAEDPGPLLAEAADALDRYRRAVRDLAVDPADTGVFREAVRGLRAGIVIDGESAWLYDAAAERWMYADGSRLAPYAVASGPDTPPAPQPGNPQPGNPRPRDPGPAPGAGAAEPAHEPTRVADRPPPEPGGR